MNTRKVILGIVAIPLCGLSAIGIAQDRADVRWTKAITSENNTIKFSRDGSIITNGNCVWRTSDGALLATINSYFPMRPNDGGTVRYYHSVAPNDDGSKVWFGLSQQNLISSIGIDGVVERQSYPHPGYPKDTLDMDCLGQELALSVSKIYHINTRQFTSASAGPSLRLLDLNAVLSSGPAYFDNGFKYNKGPSEYPVAVTGFGSVALQMSSTGVSAYRISDGLLLWQKAIPNLNSYHVSALFDQTTFVYNTEEALGQIVANFCDVSDGHLKGSSVVPAPVQGASPVDNTLIVQWSWGPYFDPRKPHSATPLPTAEYAFDPITNTCSFLRELAATEPVWNCFQVTNCHFAAGPKPAIVSDSGDGLLRVRRIQNGVLARTLPAGDPLPEGPLPHPLFAFSPDGQYYAVSVHVGGQPYLEIRRSSSGATRIRRPLPAGSDCLSVSWSAGLKLLASTHVSSELTSTVVLFSYDGIKLEQLGSWTVNSQNAFTLSADGETAFGGQSAFDALSGVHKWDLPSNDFRVLDNGLYAVINGGDPISGSPYSVEMKIYDISSYSPVLLRTVTDVFPAITSSAFSSCWDVSPDGKWILVGEGHMESVSYSTPYDPSVNAWQMTPRFHLLRVSDGALVKDIAYPFSVELNHYGGTHFVSNSIMAAFSLDSKTVQIYSHPAVYSVAVP